MFSISKLGTKSSITHCTAPTGRNGRHCGRKKPLNGYGNGKTCLNQACQAWYWSKVQ